MSGSRSLCRGTDPFFTAVSGRHYLTAMIKVDYPFNNPINVLLFACTLILSNLIKNYSFIMFDVIEWKNRFVILLHEVSSKYFVADYGDAKKNVKVLAVYVCLWVATKLLN